jgi:hypothetical protein
VTVIRQVVGAIGALAVLAACGGGGDDGGDSDFANESAANIQKAANEDMDAAKSLRMEGSVTQQGTEIGRDLTVNTDGDCTGTFSVVDQDATAELLIVDGTSYVKPDEAFWKAQAGKLAEEIIAKVGDSWVQAPEGDESFSGICDVDALLDEVDGQMEKPTKGETTDVDGQGAIELTSDSEAEGGTTSVWVAVDDPHHILKVEQEAADAASASFNFSEFDEDVAIEAPAEEDVVPAEELPRQ